MTGAAFDLPDADATMRAGASLACALHGGLVVTLAGDLGAGKTTFVRGVLRALGWTGRVKSPTYALVELYPFSSLYFYHFDFYRLASPDEWEAAGLAECFHDASVCMIEWPERAGDRLPRADLALTLEHRPDGRLLRAVASTEAGERCLRAMSEGLADRSSA